MGIFRLIQDALPPPLCFGQGHRPRGERTACGATAHLAGGEGTLEGECGESGSTSSCFNGLFMAILMGKYGYILTFLQMEKMFNQLETIVILHGAQD